MQTDTTSPIAFEMLRRRNLLLPCPSPMRTGHCPEAFHIFWIGKGQNHPESKSVQRRFLVVGSPYIFPLL